jgi:hypothetical protein
MRESRSVKYVRDAWEPTTTDLTRRDALTPNYDEFWIIYQPTRQVCEYRSKEDDGDISAIWNTRMSAA